MDSGNSGSLQSSSGGDDEEYDSQADHRHHSSLFPSFLNSSSAASATAHFGHIASSNPNLSSSLLSHHLPTTPALFDPSTSYLQALSSQSQPHNSSVLLNMDLLRPSSRAPVVGQRSADNCTDLGNFTASPSNQQSMFGNHHHHQLSAHASLMHSRSVIHDDGAAAAQHGKFGVSSSSDHHGGGHNQAVAAATTTTVGVRNSKKRTRASRRAPTTVLTTDTSNFRAMVQEFTGIPAPPFSGSSYSRRLDLFGSRSSGHLDPMGSLYPLRPAAHKIQPFLNSNSSSPSLLNSSVMLDATNSATTAGNFNSTGTGSNYMNMQNPILSFQSLLQPQMLSSLEDQAQLGTGQGQDQTQGGQPLNAGGVGSVGGWRLGGVGSSQDQQHHQLRASNDGGDEGGYNNSSQQQQQQQKRINNGGKFNYSSEMDHQNKGFDHAPAGSRGDGTVDSWICPSD